MSGYTLGHGADADVNLGPLINARQLAAVQSLVDDATARGATVRTGGRRHGTSGFFFEPTVLTDVPPDARILRQEIFGPVAPIIAFDTEDEVVAKANNTEYGLSSYVFTRDLNTALRVSEAIDSGLVGLNQGSVSNAGAPFGGTKLSGLGREGGKEGIEEYLETKFIALQLP
jgi:succinate-semialdehyde dehydrogenase/glutarate-semialdehyde dehydrogenase